MVPTPARPAPIPVRVQAREAGFAATWVVGSRSVRTGFWLVT